MTSCYLDASAIVKLVADEPESAALRAWVLEQSRLVTNRISSVEVVRALRRKGAQGSRRALGAVQAAFQSVAILELDAAVAERAANLVPPTLRSLDAVHLASALSLADEVDVLVTYDQRLADAARAASLTVVAPA